MLESHLLSVFEVCFEGVAETFGVFHKLLFLVLQGLKKLIIIIITSLSIRKKSQNKTRDEKHAIVCVFVFNTHSAILVLIFLNDIVDCVQELFYGARYVSAGNKNNNRSEEVINTDA